MTILEKKIWQFLAACFLLSFSACQKKNSSKSGDSVEEHQDRTRDAEATTLNTSFEVIDQTTELSPISELGIGYNTDKKLTVGKCIIGSHEYIGGQSSNLVFKQESNLSTVEQVLDAAIDGKHGAGSFSAKVKAAYNQSSRENELGMSMVFSYTVNSKSARFVMKGLTRAGENAIDARRWAETCGHQYVDSVDRGSKIYITMNFSFADKATKKDFDANIDVNSGASKIAADLSGKNSRFKNKVTVTISLAQIGGKVSELAKALSSNDGNELPIFSCSINKMEECTAALDAASHYAVNNFTQQIDENNPDQSSGPAVLNKHYKEYSSLGIYSPKPIDDILVKQSRRQLNEWLEKDLKYWDHLNKVIKLRGETNALTELEQSVNENLILIGDAVQNCYNKVNLGQCQESVNRVGDQRIALDPNNDQLIITIKDMLKVGPYGLSKAIANNEISIEEAEVLVCKYLDTEDEDAQAEINAVRDLKPEYAGFCYTVPENGEIVQILDKSYKTYKTSTGSSQICKLENVHPNPNKALPTIPNNITFMGDCGYITQGRFVYQAKTYWSDSSFYCELDANNLIPDSAIKHVDSIPSHLSLVDCEEIANSPKDYKFKLKTSSEYTYTYRGKDNGECITSWHGIGGCKDFADIDESVIKSDLYLSLKNNSELKVSTDSSPSIIIVDINGGELKSGDKVQLFESVLNRFIIPEEGICSGIITIPYNPQLENALTITSGSDIIKEGSKNIKFRSANGCFLKVFGTDETRSVDFERPVDFSASEPGAAEAFEIPN